MNQNFDYIPQNDRPTGYPQAPQPPKGSPKGFAIASLCLGIASVCPCLCCCCFYLMLPLSVLGIVMAILAKRNNGGVMPGMAIAGMILSIAGLALFVFMLVVEIIFMAIPDAEWTEMIKEFIGEVPSIDGSETLPLE